MMKKISISIIALLFILMASCGDDFTENAPLGVDDVDTYFLEEGNAEKAIIGLYDLMQYTYARDWHSAFFVKLLPGDDANAAGGNKDDQAQLQDIDDHTNISVSNQSIQSVWDLMYRTIALANLIITEVESGTLMNKEVVLAEAKFMRAWCYFELTTMFGDIPMRTTVPNSAAEFAVAKSPRAEIYTLIESDLTAAIAGLPVKSAVADAFRFSKGAAQGLMGKVLVFQEKYTESLPFFESVISSVDHDLVTNPSDVWLQAQEFGKESLVEIGFISTSGVSWADGSVAWGGRMESNLHIQLMGPRGDGIFDLGNTGLINGWGFNLPTQKLAVAFDAAGDVTRKRATLMTESELVAEGGAVDQTKAPGGAVWDYEGAIRTKYATRTSETTADGVKELNYSTNFRLFRYAELLLLAAEAYNMTGQDSNARTELNKVRNRAGLADISATTSGDDLFDAIVDEKFLELAHEGQRFWDLVRWGRAATELAGTGYSSKNDLFPIPISEIDKNTALGPEDQNPGY